MKTTATIIAMPGKNQETRGSLVPQSLLYFPLCFPADLSVVWEKSSHSLYSSCAGCKDQRRTPASTPVLKGMGDEIALIISYIQFFA